MAPASSSFGNSTGLGQGVLITANNQVRVGNTGVTSIGGQVGWSTFSDARIKTDIKEDVPGLGFIMQLRPVTYYYDDAKLYKLQTGTEPPQQKATVRGMRYTGLIAQEVEAAAKAVQYDFSGVDKPENANTPYGLRYAELVVPLVKAVQEMKQLIERQQKEIEELRKKTGTN